MMVVLHYSYSYIVHANVLLYSDFVYYLLHLMLSPAYYSHSHYYVCDDDGDDDDDYSLEN